MPEIVYLIKKYYGSNGNYIGDLWDLAGLREECSSYYESHDVALKLCEKLNEANGAHILEVVPEFKDKH